MVISPCNGNAPNQGECIHSGRGEGIEGYEFECSDGVNNDYDEFVDCMEDRCAFRPDCIERCDKDRDGVKDQLCGGQDCHPDDPNLPGAPNEDGDFVESACSGGVDEDCDGERDCRDTDCNQDEQTCPQCDTDGDGLLSPDCAGSDCLPDDPARPTGNLFSDGWHETACGDGVSNDCDDDIDCADTDCIGDAACPQLTPTPTPIPGGGGGGGGNHCWLEIDENGDCCPWDPAAHTCYGCDPIILINCD